MPYELWKRPDKGEGENSAAQDTTAPEEVECAIPTPSRTYLAQAQNSKAAAYGH